MDFQLIHVLLSANIGHYQECVILQVLFLTKNIFKVMSIQVILLIQNLYRHIRPVQSRGNPYRAFNPRHI